MIRRDTAAARVAAGLILATGLIGCKQPAPSSTPVEATIATTANSPAPATDDLATATPQPSATAVITSNPNEKQLINTPEDSGSPYQFIYVDTSDAVGDVPVGANGAVNFRDTWRVKIIGQSADGIFVKVVFSDIEPGPDAQNYLGQTGWIYSYWAGFSEPILPAQFEVVQEPTELDEHRQQFYNYYIGEIYVAMATQGTPSPDDESLVALNATQTQWAVLQTPQP